MIDIQLHPRAADTTAPPASAPDPPPQTEQVTTAQAAARTRWASHGHRLNAQIPGPVLRQPRWLPPRAATAPLRHLLDAGAVSPREYDLILRLAWTSCDLAGKQHPDVDDITYACVLHVPHTTIQRP